MQDLPSSGHRVQLRLQVKRFRCDDPACSRQTFAEQPIALVPRSAQRTQRCNHSLTQVVLNVGGEVGARVLRYLGIVVSGDTLLRLARKDVPRDPDRPRHIGVDDWAWKRVTIMGR